MNDVAWERGSRRRLIASAAALVTLALVAGVLLASCGSSKSGTSSQATTRSVQIMATVTRGDLVETVSGRLELTSTKGAVKGAVQLEGDGASNVVAGQQVTVTFVDMPAGGQGQGGQGGAMPPSGAPPAGQDGQGFTPPTGAPPGASGQPPQGMGDGVPMGGATSGPGPIPGGKAAEGTVQSVVTGADGTTTAMVTITKLPSGVDRKSVGFARIETRVLASDVLLVPTAAVSGQGADASVQVIEGGKTHTQSVTVGQQTQSQTEITSGLQEGQSLVYTRTFSLPAGGRAGQGMPGAGGQGMPSGAPPGGMPGGASAGAPSAGY